MPRNLSNAVLCLAAIGWIAPAAAQAIYRCGDSYSQRSCPGGTLVDADDQRSAGQRSQTSLAAQRDAKAADAMEKARLKEEAKPAQGAFIPVAPKVQDAEKDTKMDAGAKPKRPKKPKKPVSFSATTLEKPAGAQVKQREKTSKKKPA